MALKKSGGLKKMSRAVKTCTFILRDYDISGSPSCLVGLYKETKSCRVSLTIPYAGTAGLVQLWHEELLHGTLHSLSQLKIQ
jgi:hypothetical protein